MTTPEIRIARVAKNVECEPGCYRLLLKDAAAEQYEPGQFLQIRGWKGSDPLLGRPFSIAERVPDPISPDLPPLLGMYYTVMGRGTRRLSELTVGDKVQITGPLGCGFDREAAKGGTALIVAGGIGIAPFPFLAETLKADGIDVVTILGARDRHALYRVDQMEALCSAVHTVTDAGDLPGEDPANAIQELERIVADRGSESFSIAYGCGPEPMLRAMVDSLEKLGIAGEISLERVMGCGVGICYSCVVKCRTENDETPHHKRTCLDGPVMKTWRLQGIDW